MIHLHIPDEIFHEFCWKIIWPMLNSISMSWIKKLNNLLGIQLLAIISELLHVDTFVKVIINLIFDPNYWAN